MNVPAPALAPEPIADTVPKAAPVEEEEIAERVFGEQEPGFDTGADTSFRETEFLTESGTAIEEPMMEPEPIKEVVEEVMAEVDPVFGVTESQDFGGEGLEPMQMTNEVFSAEPMEEMTVPIVEFSLEPEPLMEAAPEPEPLMEETVEAVHEPEPLMAAVPEPEPEPMVGAVPEPEPIQETRPIEPEPTPFDFDAYVENYIKNLDKGKITFNPLEEMKVGISETVEVRITKSLSLDLTRGLKGRGIPKTEVIEKVGGSMEVELYGDNFKIISNSPSEQPVVDNDVTYWEWTAPPRIRASNTKIEDISNNYTSSNKNRTKICSC